MSVFDDLVAGNKHWVEGKLQHPNQTIQRRLDTASHQDPVAVIFGCIDSRVPPEIVFDQGIGDLFVIRTGAQVLDEEMVFGSIQFGPSGYESARLIVVLGHERCGAVIAAIDSIESNTPAPDHIQAVVNALIPAYNAAPNEQGADFTEKMVRAQVRLTVGRLTANPLLSSIPGLQIVGGYYGLASGFVDFFIH